MLRKSFGTAWFRYYSPEYCPGLSNEVVSKSTWFPRVSEIRAEAGKIVGHQMVSTWEPPQNYLMARFYELENQFFHQGFLDSAAWLSLANEFDRCDRPYSAGGARQRLATFHQILSDETDNNESPDLPPD